MISTLQKCLQYAALSLVGSLSSSRIGSHIGHDRWPAYSVFDTCRIVFRSYAGGAKSMVAKKLVVSGSEEGGCGYM